MLTLLDQRMSSSVIYVEFTRMIGKKNVKHFESIIFLPDLHF